MRYKKILALAFASVLSLGACAGTSALTASTHDHDSQKQNETDSGTKNKDSRDKTSTSKPAPTALKSLKAFPDFMSGLQDLIEERIPDQATGEVTRFDSVEIGSFTEGDSMSIVDSSGWESAETEPYVSQRRDSMAGLLDMDSLNLASNASDLGYNLDLLYGATFTKEYAQKIEQLDVDATTKKILPYFEGTVDGLDIPQGWRYYVFYPAQGGITAHYSDAEKNTAKLKSRVIVISHLADSDGNALEDKYVKQTYDLTLKLVRNENYDPTGKNPSPLQTTMLISDIKASRVGEKAVALTQEEQDSMIDNIRQENDDYTVKYLRERDLLAETDEQ